MRHVFSVYVSTFRAFAKVGRSHLAPRSGRIDPLLTISRTSKAIALGTLLVASLLSVPGARESHRDFAQGLRMALRLLAEPQGKAPLATPSAGFVGRKPTRSPTVSANLT
jgi:hypothetical protein